MRATSNNTALFSRPLTFPFGRFENEDDRHLSVGSLEMAVEMTQGIDPLTGKPIATVSIKQSDISKVKGFDNPFYDPSCPVRVYQFLMITLMFLLDYLPIPNLFNSRIPLN